MAASESFYKYASIEAAETILGSNSLRWSSPALFDEPWAVNYDPKLPFDHMVVSKQMLKTAVAMIFTRQMPKGNLEHPLYKAITRWRHDDRFNDEAEAYDALSELLAPTPETLEAKLKFIVSSWMEYVSNSRVLCISDSARSLECWSKNAENYRGVVFKFDHTDDGIIQSPQPMKYGDQRPHLTTVKEQVEDLIGIKRALVIERFDEKILTKNKTDAGEKEWRCVQVLDEEDLDCGEDIEDWYMDAPFDPAELKAVYLGFRMPAKKQKSLTNLLKTSYPGTAIYTSRPTEGLYDLEFKKI